MSEDTNTELRRLQIENTDLKTREQVAKNANDAMQAERDRLRAQIENLLKPQRDQAIARAEAAEKQADSYAEQTALAITRMDAAKADLAACQALCAELRDHLALVGKTYAGDIAEQALRLAAKTPATMGEEIKRLRIEREDANVRAAGLCGDIQALRQQLADVNVSLSRRDDTITALRARVAELQGECDRLAKREAELMFEAGKAQARVAELEQALKDLPAYSHDAARIYHDLCACEKVRDMWKARNARLVAAAQLALPELQSTLDDCRGSEPGEGYDVNPGEANLERAIKALAAALADNGGATAGPVSTASTRPADMSKNGAGIDTPHPDSARRFEAYNELREFVRRITLRLQKHRALTDAQKDADFQDAYRLYVKHQVEHAAMQAAKEGAK